MRSLPLLLVFLANLAQAVRTKAIEWSEPSARLVTGLESAGRAVGPDP